MKKIALILTTVFCQLTLLSAQADHFIKARALMEKKAYDSALVILNQAESEDPGNLDIKFNKGLCHYHSGNFSDARSNFLLVSKRQSGPAQFMLAKTEARLNHPELSVKYLREHLQSYYKLPEKEILLDKDLALIEHTDAWKNLWKEKSWYSDFDQKLQEADYLKSTKKYLEAINIMHELEKKSFKSSIVNQKLAELYMELDNEKAAFESISKSVSVDSRNTEALKLRIKLLNRRGEYSEAKKECERLLRQEPDAFDYYQVAGKTFSKSGEYEKGIKIVQDYLSLFPGSHEAMNTLGEIHFENNKYLEALKSFNNALELETSNAFYYLNRGKTYNATQTYRYAVKDFSMALDLDPKNPDFWYAKGIADMELGNRDNACYNFRKALQYGNYEAADYVDKFCI